MPGTDGDSIWTSTEPDVVDFGSSERTVSAEVREVGRRLGGSNHAHTIARICGAPA